MTVTTNKLGKGSRVLVEINVSGKPFEIVWQRRAGQIVGRTGGGLWLVLLDGETLPLACGSDELTADYMPAEERKVTMALIAAKRNKEGK